MGITKRKAVFETNSSSSHSITIEIGTDWDNIIPDDNGVIIILGSEFGWQVCSYDDAETKASYAYQDRVSKSLLREVIKDYTGARKVKFEGRKDGYIDHQSSGTAREICTNYEDTKNFIFNKDCILYTDNDNH